MDELPHIDMEESDINFINDAYHKLQKRYPAEIVDSISCDLNTFSIFEKDDLSNSKVFIKIYDTDRFYYLAFVDVTYTVESGRRYGTDGEVQLWGVFNLANEYPHILIRRKTFNDKIIHLIEHGDLVFSDDKEFSSKFYVQSDDKNKALISLSTSIRNKITEIESTDILIEIIGKKLIVGNKRKRTMDDLNQLVAFLDKLHLNRL